MRVTEENEKCGVKSNVVSFVTEEDQYICKVSCWKLRE